MRRATIIKLHQGQVWWTGFQKAEVRQGHHWLLFLLVTATPAGMCHVYAIAPRSRVPSEAQGPGLRPCLLSSGAWARIQLTLDLATVGVGSVHTHDMYVCMHGCICECVRVCVRACVYPHGPEGEVVILVYHVQST